MDLPRPQLNQRVVRSLATAIALLVGATCVGVGAVETFVPGGVSMAVKEVRDAVAYAVQGDDYTPTAVSSSED